LGHGRDMILKNLIMFTLAPLMVGCSNPTQQNSKASLGSEALNSDCTWNKEVFEVPFGDRIIVSFDHKKCLNDGLENVYTSKLYELETNGIKVNSAYADVVFDYFDVLEKTDLNIEDFLLTLIKKHIDHEGDCKPKQISENKWTIEDGLSSAGEINFMPCGRFGRNFSGQTIFQVNDLAILHYNLPSKDDDINKKSIKLESVQ